MSLPYFLRPRADRDIDEISDEMAERAGLDVALRFLQEFYETCALLSTQPEMGWPTRVRHPQLVGVRTVRVSERFDQYLVFYVLPGQRIEVLRVLHGAQDIEALFAREAGGAKPPGERKS